MNSDDHDLASGPSRPGRGRPRDLNKRQAILEAAAALFLERGIAATTMESVAERAMVSKMTVYSHFPDKPALLGAVFARNLRGIRLPDLSEQSGLSPLERLSDFGERLVGFLTRPEIVRTGRVMAASADDFPALAAAFYAAGPGAVLAKLAPFLRTLDDSGAISVPDPELAGEQLAAAWLGVSQLKQSLGVSGPPSSAEIAVRVRLATETMLRGWAAGGNSRERRIGANDDPV
jgi:TetR/AcrR family transcriptional regulator, mexJK operon transcriptional repressor